MVLAAMRTIMLVLLSGFAALAQAQTSPARGPAAAQPPADDMPLTDYLGLLEQIAPAARQGAEAYLDAFRHRCGRPLRVAELRRAFAEHGGDPRLMQMIRASYLRDADALARLAADLPCPGAR